MRIESIFKDYYDKIQAYGMDQDYVYYRKTAIKPISTEHPFVRKMQEYLGGWEFRHNEKEWYDVPEYLACTRFIVGHSGKFINGFQCTTWDWGRFCRSAYFYSQKELVKYLKGEQGIYIIPDEVLSEIAQQEMDFELKISANYALEGKYEGIIANFFHEIKAPLFLFNITQYPGMDLKPKGNKETVLILNPCLANIDFQKYQSAQSCYQEIFQFLTMDFKEPEARETPMSNLDKVNQHGFDPKYGFRKRPGTKKGKRKKKR